MNAYRTWPAPAPGCTEPFPAIVPDLLVLLFLFSTRQYARLVDEWVTAIDLRAEEYGTHSLRRTKASMICRGTGNIRAMQSLLGRSEIENTVRYLGVDVEDALLLLREPRSDVKRPSGPSARMAALDMRNDGLCWPWYIACTRSRRFPSGTIPSTFARFALDAPVQY
jgi:hypothetical protein